MAAPDEEMDMDPWEIAGHEWAAHLLRQHIQNNALRHAYLLTGPAGVGRRTLAVRLAQAVQCPSPLAPGVACRVCRTCLQIEAGQHIDLMVTQAEAEGGTLKVEQVREVTRFLALKPYQSPLKIVLFLRFEEANTNAQNALLKTLEEAPRHALLLLTADNTEQLLPTIVSRCETLRLRPMKTEAVQEFLASRRLEAEQAHLLAHLAGGRPGYALRLASDERALALRVEKLDDLYGLLAASRRERFEYAEKLVKDKDLLRQTLFVWLSFWRDVLLQAAGSDSALTNIDRAEAVTRLAGQLSLTEARSLTRSCEQAIERLEKNVNPRLLLEVTLMDWPRLRQ